MAVIYHIEQLTKIYKNSSKKANEAISLDIFEGEIFGLLGPNGAGKSTLVNQITGLVRPTSGHISLFGKDVIKQTHIIPHYVSLQPQYSLALADMYPEEVLLYTAQLRGATTASARIQVRGFMKEFDLDVVRKKRLRFLSGGQRQLVNLAVAMIEERPVQIFDEPTNNLDPSMRQQIWEKLPVPKLVVVIAIISMALLFALPGLLGSYFFGSLLLGLPLSGAWTLLFLIPLGVLPLAGVGALLGTLAPNGQVAGLMSNVVLIVVGFLSPMFIPPQQLPKVLQITSLFVPTTYVADAFRSALGAHFGANFVFDVVVLALCSCVCLFIAQWKMEWRTL